jgi:putative membrane protein
MITANQQRMGRLGTACCIAALAAGCAPVLGPPPVTASVAAPAQVAPAGSLDATERALMSRLATGGLYEIEVSRLASDRATDPRVRSYAQAMASHDAEAHRALAELMRAKGVPMPTGLPADKATKLHRLSQLKPSPNFDIGYVRVVGVEDHLATLRIFERAQREARDRDLQAWIARTLPVVRADLAAARKLTGVLG